MKIKTPTFFLVGFALVVVFAVCGPGSRERTPGTAADGSVYEDLLDLFREFREYQKPQMNAGVPDYSDVAMREQIRRLPAFQARVMAFNVSAWPISRRVDYEIVRAEMNGLEFDHRVLRPWARDPSFYAVITTSEPDVPAREGPEIHGVLNLFEYAFPLDESREAEVLAKLEAVPGVLGQARRNLIEGGKDLWTLGLLQKKREVGILNQLAERLADSNPRLVSAAESAAQAVSEFIPWLEENLDRRSEASDGIGVEAFDWYMRNVHLVPYTWKQQEDILHRELERSWTALKLEEHRNMDLPPLLPPATLEELQGRVREGVDDFMGFLRNREIFTVADFMRLDSQARFLVPPEGWNFWNQVSYRDQLPLLCHQVHWLEKQREARNTHLIRGVPLLYNIWDSRAEGFATAFEETMMQAGLMDRNPRSRELVWILLAFRAARAMGDLKMHSREWTFQEAMDFGAEMTPRGWIRSGDDVMHFDTALYLRQPGYGTSYVYGKIMFERLLSDVARQKGDDFTLKGFLDAYFDLGLIPASLIRWEMTGLDDEMKTLGR